MLVNSVGSVKQNSPQNPTPRLRPTSSPTVDRPLRRICETHPRLSSSAGWALDAGHYFFVKMDFGIMQCTPLRMSTTCDTRQSPIIEVSE